MRPTVARLVSIVTCAIFVVLLCGSAPGQTVPGEKWKQKITVSMEGMTMPMGTVEICAPAGRTEDLMKPDKNCTTSNVHVVGDTTSADVVCTGRDAMTGNVTLTVTGNTVSGKARMKTRDGEEMVMMMESTRLGPCQAIDTAAVIAKAEATPVPKIDPCAEPTAMLKKDPASAGPMAPLFAEPGQVCTTRPANPAFCAAIQTRAGFSSLVEADGRQKGIAATSVAACALGKGSAGVDALRKRLVLAAEADGDSGFLITHAPARAKEIARSQCVLAGEMWAGRSPKWDAFCDSNFAGEARGE